MTYGKVHTDGSRSGGQPIGTNDQPSDAALRKVCEVLGWGPWDTKDPTIIRLARHFDVEDKAAREALGPIDNLYTRLGGLEIFAQRFVLPEPKPTVGRVILSMPPEASLLEFADALRDAGLMRET